MKKYIIGFLIGLFVCGIIGVSAATYLYHSDEVSYTPSNNDWKVNNVNDALNDLYERITNTEISELDLSDILYTFNDTNKTYTATKDCYLYGRFVSGSGQVTGFINGKPIVPASTLIYVKLHSGDRVNIPYSIQSPSTEGSGFITGLYIINDNSSNNSSTNSGEIDLSNATYLFDQNNKTYTATKDCYLYGRFVSGSGQVTGFINGKPIVPASTLINVKLHSGDRVNIPYPIESPSVEGSGFTTGLYIYGTK